MSDIAVLVSVDAKSGVIRRYIGGSKKPFLTHEGELGTAATFTQAVVYSFMHAPPEHLRVHPDKPPPPPPAGGTPVAAQIASAA